MRSFRERLPTLLWVAGAAATVGAMLAALRV
ncbi:hypothetical protein J2X26_002912 [Cellulomonas humilata]|uniref:Uncharacterized protein n=1 Tax=Cellulomonas humilata TaxID=144055 RepID=A0ABU0EH40_9CELL|nr:hypothetical protein [Cellulomonas humilata]